VAAHDVHRTLEVRM